MIAPLPQPEPDQRQEERARALALEKSYLELVIRLMSRIGAATGVENVVDTLLRNVVDVIGGTNIVLYYTLDERVCSVDVYGQSAVHSTIDDPVVARVFATHEPVECVEDFAETRMATPEFTKGYTWVYPLVAGQELVGVLRMEHLHIGMRALHKHLPVFFTYVAQLLKNEVQSFGRLRNAYDELNAANAALREENAARRRTEDELRRAKEDLELRVAERTREIEEANRQLERELAEHRLTEDVLTRRNEELAVRNRFLRSAGGDLTPQELLDLACRELTAALRVPHGLAWFVGMAPSMPSAEPESPVRPRGESDEVQARSLTGCLVADQRPLAVGCVSESPHADELARRFPGLALASALALPVSVSGRVAACVLLASPQPGVFDEEAVALASRIGDQVADSLERLIAQADSRRLTAAIEQTPDSVMVTDAAARILYVNPAFTAVTGYSRAEVVGRHPRELKSGQHDRQFYEQMWSTLLSGETWRGRLTNRKKNGDLFTEDAIIVPVRDSRGRVSNYIALKRDITRELAREEHLRHAQRMEMIGQLAGGIAHDFNNLLGVMLMQLEMMQLEQELPQALAGGISEVRRAAERASRLTRQLLTLGRRQTLRMRDHDLNEVIRNQVALLERVLPESITLAFEPCADRLPFSGDATMLEQVVMNLCVNARDAMPQGGKLTISTGLAEFVDGGALPHPDARPGRFVWVRATDTGCGMPPDVLERAFEPFFTTKAVGRGTGLGLATSYGIVSQHHGWIDARSEVGHGSKFTVYVPWVQSVPTTLPAGPARRLEGGHAAVLLVEDEAVIRSVVQRSLEQLGYRVAAAADGLAALDLWAREHGRFDLLLSDVVMPNGVSGVELSRQLKRQKPDLRVVLMSGYAADIAREGGQIDKDVAFLSKPFTLVQLGHVVRQALGGAASGA